MGAKRGFSYATLQINSGLPPDIILVFSSSTGNMQCGSIVMTFSELFIGNSKTFGQHNPHLKKTYTLEGVPGDEHWESHLGGGIGVGRVPILDDNTCRWGAIDIDCHDDDTTININNVAKVIFVKGLPLIACRSKSGGVHCYVFTSEPVPASLMRTMLKKWAEEIEYGGSEVFPKQVNLRDNQLGNWINLPYFNSKETGRYAVEIINNKPLQLSLDEFLEAASKKSITEETFRAFALIGHEQAPPCIQSMMLEGVHKGYRNEAIYAFTVYFRQRSDGASYKNDILALNQQIFDRPLPLSEVSRTVKSAARRDYKYKCIEEPCRSLCNSKVCLNRDYGIQPNDTTGEGVPTFSDLTAISTEPPLWQISVNDTPIIVSTNKLRNFNLFAEEIMERIFVVSPILKQKDWMEILSVLMGDLKHMEVPDNASTSGMIREHLQEFLTRADINSPGTNEEDKDLLTRGLPIVRAEGPTGKRIIMFKGSDFVTYLKRTRSEDLKGNALWMALRKAGVKHKRIRIGRGKIMNVWCISIDGKGRTALEPGYDPDSIFIHSNPQKVVKILNGLNF